MIILASKSPIRQTLLANAGLTFRTEASPLDETAHKSVLGKLSAETLAQELAKAKALALSHARPGDIIIGADQTLGFAGETLHKCTTMDEAQALLQRLSGKTHTLHAAIAIAQNGQILRAQMSTVLMKMRPLSHAAIAAYLNTAGTNVLGSVGCYHFEGQGAQLFEKVEGDYHAILGLPLLPLLAILREIGELEP